MAPILPFTTEEVWEHMPVSKGKEESIHLEKFPDLEEVWLDDQLLHEWEELILVREKVLKKLEDARESGLIGNSLEASVILNAPAAEEKLLRKYETKLPSLFIVSAVELRFHSGQELTAEVKKAAGEKCLRCWNYSTHVGKSSAYPHFCQRCEEVVKEMRL